MFGAGIAASQNAVQNTAALAGMLAPDRAIKRSNSQTIFNGRIQVDKVANGYVINIATREGYEFETYIASTIQEVNERIAASMVSFQLEGK
jgi:hypothetical protein